MSDSTVLRFEQLVLSRSKQRVAGPLDFSLSRGERGLVSGPNGSGKTTLVLAIAGTVAPTSGNLIKPDHIGLVPQEPEFPLHLTCRTYFSQLLALTGSGPGDIRETLQLFGLEPFADRRIGELSRGWRQRLNLARAWLAQPDLLVLDEPQTALDPTGMATLAKALDSIPDTTVLIVAPEGVGCCSLAPLKQNLTGGSA